MRSGRSTGSTRRGSRRPTSMSKDYPILLPAVEAAGFRFSGYETSLLDLQSLVFFAAFLRFVYEVGARRARDPLVLVGACFLCSSSRRRSRISSRRPKQTSQLRSSSRRPVFWRSCGSSSGERGRTGAVDPLGGRRFGDQGRRTWSSPIALFVVLALVFWASDHRRAFAAVGAGAVLSSRRPALAVLAAAARHPQPGVRIPALGHGVPDSTRRSDSDRPGLHGREGTRSSRLALPGAAGLCGRCSSLAARAPGGDVRRGGRGGRIARARRRVLDDQAGIPLRARRRLLAAS